MKPKFLVTGAALLAVGALLILMPGLLAQFGTDTGIAPSPERAATYFVNVNPGNYSYIRYPLAAGEELTGTISAGQQAVDFFLMNGGNFTAWQSGTQASQVYPQSRLDVRNYSFAIQSSGVGRDYFIVLVSRSAASPTDVLIRLSLRSTSSDSTVASLPIVFVGAGAALALYAVGTKGRENAEPKEGSRATPPASGGWQSMLGLQVSKCKYCGTPLGEGLSFCSYCHRSQG